MLTGFLIDLIIVIGVIAISSYIALIIYVFSMRD